MMEKQQIQMANAGRNVAANPRLKEIRKSEFYSSPQNRSSHQPQAQSPNQQGTPVWLKPSDQIDQQTLMSYKLTSFDPENIMENFKTPEAVALAKRAANRQKEETPLGVVFARNLHEANENSKMQSFYTNYNPSPVIQFSYNQPDEWNDLKMGKRNVLQQQQVNQDYYNNEKENQFQQNNRRLMQQKQHELLMDQYGDKNDEVQEETNYENSDHQAEEATKPEIPDSMDIKMSLLDQLQDKLASLRNSSNASTDRASITSNTLNTSQNSSSTINSKKLSKASSNNDEAYENNDEDLMNNKNMAPMSSQIQVTLWKEEHPAAGPTPGGVSTRLRGFRSSAKLNN